MAKKIKREITDEMVTRLKAVYESNKQYLEENEKILARDGILDTGATEIEETFEMGYNNALEYVFLVLGIK